jgi:hypothetical protein
MKYLRPFSTLAVGVVLGYWVVPKVMSKVG